MRLRIVTPLQVLIDEDGIGGLRGEDASGAFGILPRHADFLTSLAVSVVRWKSGEGAQRYCAVRGGVLSVRDGRDLTIATREAIIGEDLATLDEAILNRFQSETESERAERTESTRLQLTAIRHIMRRLLPVARAGGVGSLE